MTVVHDLASALFETGRGVAKDNFPTSFQMSEYLLTQDLILPGTLRGRITPTSKGCSKWGKEEKCSHHSLGFMAI
jgi:hypothetical protein